MKKMIIILLTLCLCIGLSACSTAPQEKTKPSEKLKTALPVQRPAQRKKPPILTALRQAPKKRRALKPTKRLKKLLLRKTPAAPKPLKSTLIKRSLLLKTRKLSFQESLPSICRVLPSSQTN